MVGSLRRPARRPSCGSHLSITRHVFPPAHQTLDPIRKQLVTPALWHPRVSCQSGPSYGRVCRKTAGAMSWGDSEGDRTNGLIKLQHWRLPTHDQASQDCLVYVREALLYLFASGLCLMLAFLKSKQSICNLHSFIYSLTSLFNFGGLLTSKMRLCTLTKHNDCHQLQEPL